MPLIKINILEGWSETEIKSLMDAVHRAMVSAFKVPERDRYQILTEHKKSRMIIEDTGLDIPRTEKVVVIEVISRLRPRELKEAFYALTVEAIEADCGVRPSDVMISMIANSDEDWSFGYGRGQFLTGEL